MTATAQALSEALGDSSRRKMLGLIAADRLLGMSCAARSHLLAERLARKTVDGTIGQRTAEPEDEVLKTMHISVGDTVNIVPSAEPAATAPQTAGTASTVATAAAKRIWPYVVSAALGGGALGLGGAALLNLLGPAPAEATQNDTDTPYEVRISSGEEPQP